MKRRQSPAVTRGVKDLLGEPKRAVLKLSLPMMLAMLVQSIYQLVDGFWVAGLGADELAAVGLFFPFFIIILSLGAGLGVGGSSALSRRIGECNKEDANSTASHTVILGIIIGIVFGLPVIPFLDSLFLGMGGSANVASMAADYGAILFGGAVFLIFSNVANAILRGEGDANRAMYGLVIGAVLNIFLDPLFIYVFGMGVTGAAVATLLSMMISAGIFTYWLFLRGNTYVDVRIRGFRFRKEIIKDIFRVGIPSSIAQLSMAFSMVFLNIIIIAVGGTDGVAVFTSGWRIVMVGIIPLVGLATGTTAVVGASYGAGDREKLNTAYLYSVKIGMLVELLVAATVFLFAPQLSLIFAYSEGASRIFGDLIEFLRISAVFYPFVPLGMLTGALFQGIGRGTRSLAVTILRTFVLLLPAVYFMGITLGMGLTGVWLGIVIGNSAATLVSFCWGRLTVRGLFG